MSEDHKNHDDDSFEDDALMQQVTRPPEFPPASEEQIEKTWQTIEAQIEAGKVVAFPVVPAWSRQLLKIAALLVVGFGAAWFAAERGWLPTSAPTEVVEEIDQPPAADPDRRWLAGSDYGDRLEALLLGVAVGNGDPSGAVGTAARQVSRDLLDDNRFYQRVASRNNDPALADLLSRIEIILLTLATAPEGQEDQALATLRAYLGASDLLDEIRDVQGTVPKMPRTRPTGS